MVFTREDREKQEALAPVEQFAAQLEQRYGLHGRRKALAADIQAFLDSYVVLVEVVSDPVEPVAPAPIKGEN